MLWGAIVVAAGRGLRFGRPKQLLDLAGLPMVGWSLRAFAQMPEIVDLVVVTETESIEPIRELVAHIAPDRSWPVVAGGATRQASVAAGLLAMPERVNAVFVHDGARPLVRIEDVRAGMREVREGRGAVLAAPVVDTIKVVNPETLTVLQTLQRDTLWAAQTPQFALAGDLRRAHTDASRHAVDATDDVALLERIGVEIVVVPSSGENFKVTLPEDFSRAEAALRERATR
jgi:2-C-methyl-D-erythritol 4-phosphate cytidylyltransferase